MYHHGELTLQAHQIPCTLLFDRLTIVNVVHPRKKSVKVENNAYTFIEKKKHRERGGNFSTMDLAKNKNSADAFSSLRQFVYLFFFAAVFVGAVSVVTVIYGRETQKKSGARALT